MCLYALGSWVPGFCSHPRIPIIGAGCPPGSLYLPGTLALPLQATMVLGRDVLCQELGEALIGPEWQRHALELGWNWHHLHWDPACREKPSQALFPPHPREPLGLPNLHPSLGARDGGGTLGCS